MDSIADEYRRSRRSSNRRAYSLIQEKVRHELTLNAKQINISQALYLPVVISEYPNRTLGVLRIDRKLGLQCSGVLFLENDLIKPKNGMDISRHAIMEYRTFKSEHHSKIGVIQ